MFKLVLLLLGIAGGAGGTAAYLLSEPGAASSSTTPPALGDRVQEIRNKFLTALEEGKLAGAATQNQLRHQLSTYRLHPDRPGPA